MRPDPFSALDQVEPPDQWDDILDRAAHDTEVRLDDLEPRRPAVRQARTWVAAAAVLAMIGGGIALAAGDPDHDGVTTDPTSAPTTERPDEGTLIDGPCPFTIRPGELVPTMETGRQPVEPELGILPGSSALTFAHGQVDDMLVEVAVGTGITTTSAAGDISGATQGQSGWFDTFLTTGTGGPAPCDQIVASVRIPVPVDTVTSGLDPDTVNGLYEQATPVLDAVTAGVVLAGDDPAVGPETSELITIDGPCSFTVDPDELGFALEPGRAPVEPELGILPGSTEPTFAHGQVDDLLVEVAVGTGIRFVTPIDGQSVRAAGEGAHQGWVEVPFAVTTETGDECDDGVISVRMAMLPGDVLSDDEGLDPAPYVERATPIGDAVLAAIEVDGRPLVATTWPEAPPRIAGTLDVGGLFEVWEDPGHGLCASLGDVDLGCDDVGPVIAPDADPSTPRLGIDECCTPLWFGYLPDDAVDVVLTTATGERLDVDAVIGDGIWAVPVPEEHARDDGFDTDTRVVYRMSDGTEEPAPHVG